MALRAEAPLTPVLFTMRAEATWLVLLPLKMLLASTPFNKKVLLVSRWPFAQMGALPKPEFAPVPPGSSAFTPGDIRANCVKEPDERDCRIRHDGAGRVCNRACDAAECLLSVRIRCQHGCHREE